MKHCNNCGEDKHESEFYKRAASKDSLSHKCIDCDKKYKAKNKEHRRQTKKQWDEANKHHIKTYYAKYDAERNATNPERNRAKVAAWKAANPERVRAAKAAWDKCHPEAYRIRQTNRRARKRANGGKLSNGLAAKLFKLQRGRCACCGIKLDGYHIDHVMPLALGGPNVDSNTQLLCQPCNLKKSAKHPIDFMQSKGFLC